MSITLRLKNITAGRTSEFDTKMFFQGFHFIEDPVTRLSPPPTSHSRKQISHPAAEHTNSLELTKLRSGLLGDRLLFL